MALCQGCASLRDDGDRVAYERRVALRTDVAAALGAAAVRQMLPFADPHAFVAGAPGTRTGDAAFVVAYEQDRDGSWLPVARHRLRLVMPASAMVDLTVESRELTGIHRLPSLGREATARLEITFTSEPGDTSVVHVTGHLPRGIAAEAASALDQTFALANDRTAPALRLGEPNLRAFVCHRELGAAARCLAAGSPQRAAEHLHMGTRLLDGGAAVQHLLGELARRTGDHDFAREHLLQATLVATDPALRAMLADRLVAMDDTTRPPEAWTLDRGVAELRLHTERRGRPEPPRDYGRLAVLHSQRRDDMGELACTLLAREHTPGAIARTDAKGAQLYRRPFDLVERLRTGIDALVAESVAESVAEPATAVPATPLR